MFFPDKSALMKANDALIMCFGCKVRVQCKTYREETDSRYGIWGGEFSNREQ